MQATFSKAESKHQSIVSALERDNKIAAEDNYKTPFRTTSEIEFNFGGIKFHNQENNSKIQPKLQINQPGDQYEQEADAMADKVMRMPDTEVSQNSYHSSSKNIQRKCAHCEEEDKEKVQRKEGNNSLQSFAPPIVHNVLNSSQGRPMDNSTRSFMESRFNYNFNNVKIHDDKVAATSASSINALAYTFGNNIVFNSGYYNPRTVSGKRLLAHELTHVIQQSDSKRSWINRKEGDADDANVSLGLLDSAFVGKSAGKMIGDDQWKILKEFLRGMAGGIKSMPQDQRQRIETKFNKQDFVDTAQYTAGYTLGIIEGIGSSIYGLVEAIVTLFKLPYEIGKFMVVTMPELAKRYGPKIEAFLLKNGGIEQKMRKVVKDFIQNPRKNLAQIQAMLDAIGHLALSKVRQLGHSVAAKTLAFLEEPWFEYGRDVGKVVGQILFEVILAVASDAIGNILKEGLAAAGRLAAKVATGIIELFETIGRLFGEALEWLNSLGSKVKGEMGEMFEGVKTLLKEFRVMIIELEEGALAETGAGQFPIPSPKNNMLEARAAKPPVMKPQTAVSDLKTPTVHSSKVPKEPSLPKREPWGQDPNFHEDLHAPEKQTTGVKSPTVESLNKENKSITEANANRAVGFNVDKHHVFPQESRSWFEKRGMSGENDIDKFTVKLEKTEHQAQHGGGNWKLGREKWEKEYNNYVMSKLKEAEAAKRIKVGNRRVLLTVDEIKEVVFKIMKERNIPNDFVPYK